MQPHPSTLFEHTQPAALDASGGVDPWSSFRVTRLHECLALLRQLRDGAVPINLNGPDGSMLSTTLWSVDTNAERLSFTASNGLPAQERLVEADEAIAVAYMDSVKLQFDIQGIVLVRGAEASTLQCALPATVYRFQRRNAFRVRPAERQAPTAHFRHPAMPDMALALRVLDLSIGGCALWCPQDVPLLQAGTQLAEIMVALDAETRFVVGLSLQHVTSVGRGDGGGGVRLGCEWQHLSGNAERVLQRWITQTQKRRRLLALDRA